MKSIVMLISSVYMLILDGAAEALIKIGIEAFNACAKAMDNILTLKIGSSSSNPQTAVELFSTAWNTVMNGSIFNFFSMLGGTLVIVFFLVGYCKDSVDLKKISSLEENIWMFIRLIFAVACVSQIALWMPKLISISVDVCKKLFNLSTFGIKESRAASIVDAIDNDVVALIMGLVLMIVLIAAGVGLLTIGLSRLFKLVIYACLGPAMLSTIAGGPGINRSASIWFREFLAIVFSNIVILLALVISTKLIGMPIFGRDSSSILTGVSMIIETIAVLGLVKTADGLLSKLLGGSAV